MNALLVSSHFSHYMFFFYQYSNKYNIDCFQIYQSNKQVLYNFINLLLILNNKILFTCLLRLCILQIF